MSFPRHLRVPALLSVALTALLVFAATASAAPETRTGESTTPFREGNPSAEATLVKGDASYESGTGSVVFHLTTAAEPKSTGTGAIFAGLSTSECSTNLGGELILLQLFVSNPLLVITSSYATPAAIGLTGSFSSPQELPASKTVSGTTTTLSLTSANFAEKGFDCALIALGESAGSDIMAFPIKAPPPPPPAPAALSITNPKPQSLKVGKWKTVHVKVTNTGATTSTEGSLLVKTAKGVNVKPETQKLPILAPGGSWTVSVRVQLTEKAKKKSTLKLTGSATGAATGTGSLVLKLKQ
ncbi:MAG TPA: hypothetical protein VMH33_12030 [Solirubrobacterales bacterium]|nr:hypothetical protein [Solirubrobacterales bacterium]